MKIAYFGGDWHLGCISVLENHGHKIAHIFVNELNPYNQLLRDYAADNNIPLSCSKPEQQQISNLVDQGIDCLFSVEYPWLIPVNDIDIYTINVHPTLLPAGRGPTPIIWLLKQYRNLAGVTFHKLSQEFDQGDIIYQQPVEIAKDENWDSLMIKLHLQIPANLDYLLANFNDLYQAALKQTKGSYWPKISIKDRLIDWQSSVAEIEQLSLACGRFGVVVDVAGQVLMVNNIKVSQLAHDFAVGTIIREDQQTYVIAASDGLIIVMKSNIIEQLAQPGL